ncbi:Flagellar motor rotation protein MotB [hydrothermal vent metagenome]|uniref:Flagellar motor rotation protein MotB n=1 Tax=hydrothermal vent metagenome TaxID=652676 RepID=A0A3B0ZMP1_9ZZZZ
MADDKRQPIVVKKINKGGHGHHGGAWKVAYADFVTAMMAFFLMLWLLGSASGEQRQAIADFFQNPSAVQGPGGASTSMIQLGSGMEMPKSGDDGKKKQASEEGDPVDSKDNEESEKTKKEKAKDKKRLDSLLIQLKKSIDKSQALKPFKDQLLIQLMPEGLRVQILDKENRAMFESASPDPKYYTKALLREIADTINSVPNKISITGHTDAIPFSSKRRDYSNWELSAARANSARRELVIGGLNKNKIARVVGLGSSVLFDKSHPKGAINRRISIIVMSGDSLKKLHENEGNKKIDNKQQNIKKPTKKKKKNNKK